ncbi:MAG: SPOR domain-containing protein [Clostridium sp.]
MRYTRYNHNRRRGGGRNNGAYNFIASLAAIVVVAIILGIAVGKILLKDGIPSFNDKGNSGGDIPVTTDKDTDKEKPKDEGAVPNKEGNKEFYYLQCGVFSTKEKAETTIQGLPSGYNGFVIEENEKFKVIVGVFGSDKVQQKSDELKGASIDNIKIKMPLQGEDVDTKLKAEILDGYIEIINQVGEKDVESVNTTKFKGWLTDTMKDIKSEDKDINILVESINKLPEQLTKKDAGEITKTLYDILKNYKK